jgi:hypothetical protein
MRAGRTRNVLLALAAAAVLAGVLVAVLSGGGGHAHDANSAASHPGGRSILPGHSQTAVAADYLGLSTEQLRHELRSGLTLAQIAHATPGRSASGLLDALVEARAARLGRAKGTSKLSAGARRARLARLRKRLQKRLERIPGYVGLAASARYLGITAAQVGSQLESGRSLAQIANATPGKSAHGLIDARVSDSEAALAKTLAAGRITNSTDEALRSTLRARITREVTRPPRS